MDDKGKVGYTWYPNDWKSSNTFLDIDDPVMRYYYREILDLLYMGRGFWEESKSRFEKAQRLTISDQEWKALKARFNVIEKSPGRLFWTHESVTKRIDGRALTSAENGAKGGRKPDNEKPKNNLKNNLTENLSNNLKKPNNLLKEYNIKESNITETPVKGVEVISNYGNQSATPPPLWGASLRLGGKDGIIPEPGLLMDYRERLLLAVKEQKVGPDIGAKTFDYFCPIKPTGDLAKGIKEIFEEADEYSRYQLLEDLAGELRVWYHKIKLGKTPEQIREDMKKTLIDLVG